MYIYEGIGVVVSVLSAIRSCNTNGGINLCLFWEPSRVRKPHCEPLFAYSIAV